MEISTCYKLLVIDDDEAALKVVNAFSSHLDFIEFHGVSSPGEAIEWAKSNKFDIALSDYMMPGKNGLELCMELRKMRPESFFMIMTAYAELEMAIEAVRQGMFDFLIKPFGDSDFRAAMKRVKSNLDLKYENTLLRGMLTKGSDGKALIGDSDQMNAVRGQIKLFSTSDAPVLITGDTGTGKELAARMLHKTGPRPQSPFIAVNCSAYAQTLLESELFGHEKGAFTGADHRRIGRFEFAENGVVFLDEISEIPQPLQVKLLRVLQEREFERVGGNTPIKLNARIVSASNKKLHEEMRNGAFREDLFYRLNTLNIYIPPLKERTEDIKALADSFLTRFAFLYKKKISGIEPDAMDIMVNCSWPGNVRQLESSIEYAVLSCAGESVGKENLPGEMLAGGGRPGGGRRDEPQFAELGGGVIEQVTEFERNKIKKALDENKWNQSKTARALGMTRKQLIYRIKKYSIE